MTRKPTSKHAAAFEKWYAADRNFAKVGETLAVSEQTVRNWAERYGWEEAADRRDREAAQKAEKDAIRRRASMLVKCRDAGETLVTRGMERLQNNEIGSDQAAITAIKVGVDVWRTAEGLPTWVTEILNADNDELARMECELDARRRAALGYGPASAEGVAVGTNGNGH